MNRQSLSSFALALLLAACPGPTPTPDGGSGTTPILTSISPTRGPVGGGTVVTLNGTGFVSGATVTFGPAAAASVTFESASRLTAFSPPGAAGAVSVTVTNPGGKTSTLPAAFTYETTGTPKPIQEALVTNPTEQLDTSGAATLAVNVVGHVQVMGVTGGAGQGAGVRAEVGFATTLSSPPAAGDFTWSAATFLGDVDGAAAGDLARDAYSGMVTLAGPTSGTQASYFLAARFSTDDGATWTIADRDGSANGLAQAQLPRVVLSKSSVEWCKLGGETVEAPPQVTLRGSAAGPTIYGQVFQPSVTNQSGAGADLRGALGYGAAGTDPSTWTWVDATFNRDTGNGSNDEFMAALPNPGVGDYKFAFRFSHANGPWTYCDADGLATGGFTEDQAGSLSVTGLVVDSCVLQFPATLTSYEGRTTDQVFGRVFSQGVTDGTGAGAGVEGQLGYGPTASMDPSAGTWTWAPNGTFNIDVTGGGDEYQARLAGPAPGTYAYAWRFRLDGGAWTYCDTDGSGNGYQASAAGVLTALPFDVSECVVEAANAEQAVLPGATTQPWAVQVTVPTLTEATGQGTGVTVELGTGAQGTAPSTWTTWSAASFASDATAADRYTASLTAPSATGTSDVAFRVKVGSRPYVYCDRDGAANGFQSAQAGRLTVASALITNCRLESVSAFSIASGDPLGATVRVLIPGVSSGTGASPNLQVQVGMGPPGVNASTAAGWGWADASFAADVAGSGEDEFTARVFPAYTPGRDVSARARLQGQSWVYCDLNGSDVGGYEVNQQYYVAVGNHTALTFCNTRFPSTASPGTVIYGRAYNPGNATPLVAQLGVGREDEDPGLAWNWGTTGAFNVQAGNDAEYQATLASDAGVGLRYAWRYTLDGGVFCYGDLDGSQNGFSGGSNIGLVTAP